MQNDLLLKNIHRYVDLNKEEEDFILSRIEKKEFKSKSIILKSGECATATYFVLEGLIRNYTIDAHGNEHHLSFAGPDWWITDMYSFFGDKPAISNIETILDTGVYIFTKEIMESFFDKIPKMERFFRILSQNALVSNQQRILDKLTLTAEERYIHFIEKYPQIHKQIPQKQIASFIGVTPEFFSKMKSKMLRQK